MKFETELLINRPRLEVWEFFINRENIKLWQPTLTNIEPMSGVQGQPGAESKWIYEENGREFSLTERVLRCEEPGRYESLFENAFASNTVNHVFIEQQSGETLWTVETEYKFKTSLMKMLGPFFKKNYVTRAQREMERFKEIVAQE
jgi:uncharacterized protein YndB with AHSA1/START domain